VGILSKPLFTYTTQIDPLKTISEIQEELSGHGAKSVKIDYENGVITALSFLVDTPGGERAIKLPCNHQPVLKVLKRQYQEGKIAPKFVDEDQAYRVAWRIVLYWVKAQMAILETEMVQMEQIFLPYMTVEDGKTVYEKMLDSRFQITGDIVDGEIEEYEKH